MSKINPNLLPRSFKKPPPKKGFEIVAKMIQNRVVGEVWAALGAYRGVLVVSWGVLGLSCGVVGVSCERLEGPLRGVLGAFLGFLRMSWEGFRRLLGHLGASWGALERLGGVLGSIFLSKGS